MNRPPRLYPTTQGRVVVPVLLAGGSGSRLWPLSREQYPKQFLSLNGERSLFQETLLRAGAVAESTSPVVVASKSHRFLIAEQLREVGVRDAALLFEPEGRNTAPAAAVAAHFVAESFGPDAIVFLMSADHAINDLAAFLKATKWAVDSAAQGYIVTFGVKPTRAESGYGYLKVDAKERLGTADAYRVQTFIEKPSSERAADFIKTGDHFWNGGMFLFRSGRFLAELRTLEPETYQNSLEALDQGERQGNTIALEPRAWAGCRNTSIDYAVMEKSRHLALVPLDAGWDDVGSWTFLEQSPSSDNSDNHTRGDVVLEGSSRNLVHSSGRLVALVGVEDHVVVETPDAVLVAARERVQDVKNVVQQLKSRKRIEVDAHRRVYRPWGYYESIAQGERFQVKRIHVKPGEQLSLQLHFHRAEHWVVVRGTAKVICDAHEFYVSEDKSTYIPLGNVHRLENPGKVALELIEVQTGCYLGEDDIVRMSDSYGRTPSEGRAPVVATPKFA